MPNIYVNIKRLEDVYKMRECSLLVLLALLSSQRFAFANS